MITVKPFAALRPQPGLAERICELPYDVMSSEEAREIAAGNPLSFLHVSKPEIDLPAGTDLYAPAVYAKGAENFRRLIAEGALRPDGRPCFYLYRQVMGNHSQTGLVAASSCADYLEGRIKKHELTRPDKEDDRVKHIEALEAQTGPVFLVYRANAGVDELVKQRITQPPAIDFVAADGVRHSGWVLAEAADVQRLEAALAGLPALYIADGHHRCAAAARVYQSRHGSGESGFFLSVLFAHDQVQILAYNRVLKAAAGTSPQALLERLRAAFNIAAPEADFSGAPARKHELGFYLAGRWYRIEFRPELTQVADPVERLDATLLQKHVLAPGFGIGDPRTSKQISFVGGIRGTSELEKLVDSGEYVCAFSLYPTEIEDLMAVADAGGIMPPKSTWFEPKLRDGMFSHLLAPKS